MRFAWGASAAGSRVADDLRDSGGASGAVVVVLPL